MLPGMNAHAFASGGGNGFNIADLSFVQENTAVDARQLWFKPDGTQVFYTKSTDRTTHSRPLSTADDVSSAGSESSDGTNFGSENGNMGLAVDADGLGMYLGYDPSSGSVGDGKASSETMSPAFDVTSISSNKDDDNLVGADGSSKIKDAIPMCTDPAGTYLFAVDSQDQVVRYTRSGIVNNVTIDTGEAFDAATDSGYSGFTGIAISEDSLHIYLTSAANDRVFQWNLGTEDMPSTASYVGAYHDATNLAGCQGIFVKQGKLYVGRDTTLAEFNM